MTLLDKVRTATNALHQSLDNSLIPYIHSIRSKEDYAALLLKFYGFFTPVYDSIDAFIQVDDLPDYPHRRKPGWILSDLKDLEVDYSVQLCEQVPYINNNAAAFGALYVLEGSTLGGTIIRKMIAEKLHINKGLSFFSGYGKQTRERWDVFIRSLNDIDNHNISDEMVIQAAVATFTLFKQWLQQSCTPQLA